MSDFINFDAPFFDSNGAPLALGKVYFGDPNVDPKTNTKVPYTDAALTVPSTATQTLTSAGKFAARLYLSGDYSLTVDDADGNQIYNYDSINVINATGISYNSTTVAATLDNLNVTVSATCNFGIGSNVHAALTTGDKNFSAGPEAGCSLTEGFSNVFLGNSAGCSAVSVCESVAIGDCAMCANVSSEHMVAIGYGAFRESTSNRRGVAVGYNAGCGVTVGCENVYLGSLSGRANQSGSFNVAAGRDTMVYSRIGNCNVALGQESLQWVGYRHWGTASATAANKLCDTISFSKFLSQACVGMTVCNITDSTSTTVSAIDSATSLSLNADIFVSGDEYAFEPATVGGGNVGVGFEAGRCITQGCYNVALGQSAMTGNSIRGCDNVGLGRLSNNSLTDGSCNLSIMTSAGAAISTGCQNINIGPFAGCNVVTAVGGINIGYAAACSLSCRQGSYNMNIGLCSGIAEDIRDTGTNTSVLANQLIESGQNFLTTVSAGMLVCNITGGPSSDDCGTLTEVSSIADNNTLVLNDDIFPVADGTGKSYCIIEQTGTRNLFIGNEVGKSTRFANSNVFALDNFDVPVPLIYGDFTTASKRLVAGKELGVASLSEKAGNGRLFWTSAYEAHTLTTSTTSVTTTLAIPSGVILLGAQFRVTTAVTDDAGDDTWSAAFSGGSTTSLATGAAAAADTIVNTNIVDEKTSATTEITFTPNGGSFSAGVIRVMVYYRTLSDLIEAV